MTIEEIKDTLQTWIRTADDEFDREEMWRVVGLKAALHLIEKLELPSVEPERPHGYWIWNKRTGDYECSECGCNPIYEGIAPDESEIDKYRYCRWCGTPMEVHDGKENG